MTGLAWAGCQASHEISHRPSDETKTGQDLSTFLAPSERLSLDIDPSHPPHPQRPTLLATLEHGYRGEDRETGTVLVRYAEAQLWDLRPSRPRIAAIHAGGGLAFRRGL